MCFTIELICLIGLALSFYAYFIERKLAKNPQYKPSCELSDKFSCTKSLNSPYAALLGISNSIIGMLFYVSMFWLAVSRYDRLLFIGALAAVAASCYLAYLLIFKIKALCPVCLAIYAVNAALLVLAFYQLYC